MKIMHYLCLELLLQGDKDESSQSSSKTNVLNIFHVQLLFKSYKRRFYWYMYNITNSYRDYIAKSHLSKSKLFVLPVSVSSAISLLME